MTKESNKKSTFNIIDIFAGVGGVTVGFRAQRNDCTFKVRLMVDKDPEAREVAIRNMPDVPYLVADVHNLSGMDVRKHAGLRPDEPVHVLVGGPPCQGFSFLGKRALDDSRNIHLIDFLRLVKELRPWVAVMENVPLIITSHKGVIINEVIENLTELGYSCCADILAASDYGVPQHRKRAFVLAYRAEMRTPPQFPIRTHERFPVALNLIRNGETRQRFEPSKLPYVSVEDAIGDLPPLKAGEGDEVMFYETNPTTDYQRWARQGSIAVFNHRSRAHTKDFLQKISVIEEGGRNQELPAAQRFSDNYYSQAYARLHRSGIAQTVTTCFGNPGSGRFTHYRDLRSITVREAARFQSFPDAFVFDGLHSTQMRLVGNAVPPLLARAIGEQIATELVNAQVQQPPGRPKKTKETPEERSRIMRAVPGKNTTAEVTLRRALWAAGLRGYRLHDQTVTGTPDVTFRTERVAVFVDGCFWHGCERCYREPKSNQAYWTMKVQRNKERDATVNEAVKHAGWTVVRVWEHEVLKNPVGTSAKVIKALKRKKLARVAHSS